MATYTTNIQVDFSHEDSFNTEMAFAEISTNSKIIFKTQYGNIVTYEGRFFYTYSNGYQYLNWYNSSLNAIKIESPDGSNVTSITSANIDGSVLMSYINTNDWFGFQFYALRGDDSIFGSSYNDVLLGCSGNDTIKGEGGNDTIDGGEGENTICYSGKRSEYIINNINDGSWIISHSIQGRDGIDTITNFKYIQFSDTVLNATFSDTTAPIGIHSIPSDGETDASITDNIIYTFDEDIQRGTGNIVLKTASGTTIEIFDASTSNNLSISGSKLIIDPTNILTHDTNFYLEFSSGTIKDLAGNTFYGTTTYDFTTIQKNQIIHGTNDNDTLTGGAGNDILYGFKGNDTINGGNGVDTIILPGLPSQYILSSNTLAGIEGTDTVASIEQYRFGNLYVSNLSSNALTDPDGDGPADSPAKDILQGIADLYVAYFNRAPDVDGLMYWFREVMNGSTWTLPTISQSFSDQAEYGETYPTWLSNREFINAIYQNLFDRVPDAAGWDYWENDLNHGVPRDVFIYSIIQGAHASSGSASDKALLNNKQGASLYYSERLATSTETFDFSIDQVLNRVTADAQTVAHAEAVIDYVIENPVTLTGLINDTPAAWESFWV